MGSRRRVSLAATALLAAVALAQRSGAASGPSWCLPPLFEGGERLHTLPVPTVFWLAPLLRQHQLCHAARDRPDDPRAVLIGNSAVLGHPLPVEQTLSARLNARLAERGVRGQVFNLGWVNCYELRDAVILSAALDYRPALIIYPLTLSEFMHAAPTMWGPVAAFFDSNDTRVRELARTGMPGLDEPLQRYEEAYVRQGRLTGYLARLQDLGALARSAAEANALRLARWADPQLPPKTLRTAPPQKRYDCSKITAAAATEYQDWQSWNILAYLQNLHDTAGIQVLVVTWPIAHEPVGECYNARYSTAAVEEFNRWVRDECAARGLAYVDLHDLLPPDQFFDSIHPTADGHRRIAERLEPAVAAALRAAAPASTP